MVMVRDDPATWPFLISLFVAATAVILRRHWPITLLALSVLNTVVVFGVTGEPSPVIVAVVILLYTVAVTNEGRVTWAAGAISALVLSLTVPRFLDEPFLSVVTLAIIAWNAFAVGAGNAQRNRIAYLAAVEDRMRWAEETREEEARRRVVEERLRIARELHDVVAHHMAVINVQAATARHFLGESPEDAAGALELVRSSAASVLEEMGSVLQVLRGDDRAPLDPAPTLKELDRLVESFVSAGLNIERIDEGSVRPTPESIQLAAYRVVQESLTNARKHGSAGATLRLAYSPQSLEIDITNLFEPNNGPETPGQGLGTVGIRERVAAVGGAVEIGPTGYGQFRVFARFPLPEPDTQ
jgi:signal transduction histidine kinase